MHLEIEGFKMINDEENEKLTARPNIHDLVWREWMLPWELGLVKKKILKVSKELRTWNPER